MIEMRWATLPGTTSKPAILQYRYELYETNMYCLLRQSDEWSEWVDVPHVVTPNDALSETQK
jgi:hypothetical protein